MQHELAVIAGLPHEAIRLVFIEGAGCYGRNGTEDAAADAPLIAMTIGQPVRVHGRWRMKPHTLPRAATNSRCLLQSPRPRQQESIAVMRKMITTPNAMLRDNAAWQPQSA